MDIAPPPEEAPNPLAGVGARPRTLAGVGDEPVIGMNLALFESHFGGSIPMPLVLRGADAGGGRRALLFTEATGGRPLVVLVDATGKALWHKDRPLAGTRESARGLTITGGPEGAVLIFWWDTPTRAVAARQWGFDGSVFADYHFFDVEMFNGLDALYWPGRGWVVTVVDGVTARAAMLRVDGFRGFGDKIVELGAPNDVLSPVAAAAGVDGVFFAYVGRVRGAAVPAPPAQLWVTFLREGGTHAWPAPISLGPPDPTSGVLDLAPRVELVTAARAKVTAADRSGVLQSDGTRPKNL